MIITLKKCRVEACEGADHKFEFDRPTARELLRLEEVSGLDVDAWSEGLSSALNDVNGRQALIAILALVDMLHRRDGVKVPFDEIDVDMYDLDITLEAGEADDGGDEAGDEAGKDDPGPTKPSPRRAAGAGRASTSGAAKKAASGRKSTPTPSSSGGSTD